MAARSPARREVIVRFYFRDYFKCFIIISGCSSVGRMRHLGCRGRGIVPRHPDEEKTGSNLEFCISFNVLNILVGL